MVITIYQMARWHDGTKGGRFGKITLEYCYLPRRIVQSMRLQYFRCRCARPGRFDSPNWLVKPDFNISNYLKTNWKNTWILSIFFVPLPLQSRCNGDHRRRLSKGQASLPLHSPCTSLAVHFERESATRCSWPNESYTMKKNTRLWRRLSMKCTRIRMSIPVRLASGTAE